MNYELAKELKDAGFPQAKQGKFYEKTGEHIILAYEEHNKEELGLAYIPTLSELIEACGDGIWTLKRVTGAGNKQGWIAGQDGKQDADHTEEWEELEFGSTPEEAVARLWLSLNKKA